MQGLQQISSAIHASYSFKVNEFSGLDKAEHAQKVAKNFGYDDWQLELAEGANMGLGCGNPCAGAKLKPGETVVDLGCGAGMDLIIASNQVGKTGKVFGVDINHEMIGLAQKNIESRHLSNVELVTSSITDLSAIRSRSVDCVVSNCVINLISNENKPQVFSEAFRILKPGGRMIVCDLVKKEEMPEDLKRDIFPLVGGFWGLIDTDSYRRRLIDTLFSDIVMVQSNTDLNILFADKPSQSAVRNYDLNDYAGTCEIHTYRPLM